VYVRDLTTGATTQVTNSQTGLGPRLVAISGDGRFVAFESRSSNVVSPDGTESDLFLWTRATSAVRKLTAAPDGGSNGGGTFRNLSVSRDGRSVFFSTEAPRLVSSPVTNPDGAPAAYRWDEGRGLSLVRDFGVRGPCAPVLVGGSLSADGTTSTLMTSAPILVADTNGTTDVYAVREDGGVFAASEGTMGFFDAGACPTSTAQAPAVAQWPAVSAAGDRFVFEMSKSVLGESPSAAGVLHVVARDRTEPGFIVVSPGDAGAFPNNSSRFPFIDRSGQRVSFVSNAAAVPGPPLTVFSYRCFLSELNGRQVLRITPLVGDVDAGFPACVAAKVSGNGHAVLVVTPAPLAVGDQTLDGGAADLDLYLRLLP
jgi:hypothetical protein